MDKPFYLLLVHRTIKTENQNTEVTRALITIKAITPYIVSLPNTIRFIVINL